MTTKTLLIIQVALLDISSARTVTVNILYDRLEQREAQAISHVLDRIKKQNIDVVTTKLSYIEKYDLDYIFGYGPERGYAVFIREYLNKTKTWVNTLVLGRQHFLEYSTKLKNKNRIIENITGWYLA